MFPRLALLAACAALTLAAKAPERSFQVVTTDQTDFTGSTVRIDNAYGELNIEGWDQPRVEITVTRTAFRHDDPKEKAEGKRYLDQIRVTLKKASNGDLEVMTQFPGRNRLARVIWGLGNFNLDYRIKAPRTAKLAIRHGLGDVIVLGVASDIDAFIKTGDIVVQLDAPEKFAIDAQCRLGTIFTDYDGAHKSPWLVGQKFTAGAGHTLHLRSGLGGITIQRIPPVQATN